MSTATSERTLVITRVIDAPRARVWKAWTEPTEFSQWWGPKGFTAPVVEIDLRPGGAQLIVMRSPDGVDMAHRGTITVVEPPSRFCYTQHWSDEFRAVLAGFYEPGETPATGAEVTVTFEEQGSQTLVTVSTLLATPADLAMMRKVGATAGWESSFQCLEAHLRGEPTD